MSEKADCLLGKSKDKKSKLFGVTFKVGEHLAIIQQSYQLVPSKKWPVPIVLKTEVSSTFGLKYMCYTLT